MTIDVLTRRGEMAKKRGRPAKTDGRGLLVRLRPPIITKARAIAADKGVSMTDLLSDMLEGPMSREYLLMLRRLEQKGGGG
jgi:hypothetical protein